MLIEIHIQEVIIDGERHCRGDRAGKAAFLLRPVHAPRFKRVKASDRLFADEPVAPVLDPGRE